MNIENDPELMPTAVHGVRKVSRRSTREFRPADPDLWLYRDRTARMLRRYFRISIEAGRLPSLLGRELFRTMATLYRVATFEDAVIFVRDVERRLERLDDFERKLLLKVVGEDHTHDEAGQLLGCGRRTIGRKLPQVLDRLTEMFLYCGLLLRLPGTQTDDRDACQEQESDENLASCSE
jgi:DNA-directed RNA polymerase specialized sigma24 family protein